MRLVMVERLDIDVPLDELVVGVEIDSDVCGLVAYVKSWYMPGKPGSWYDDICILVRISVKSDGVGCKFSFLAWNQV
jgi:hypothetical protein